MAWRKWQDWFTFIAGAFLAVSPWFLNLMINATTQWMFVVLGAIMAIVALFALANPRASDMEWLIIISGAFTFVSPWLFGFSGNARWEAWLIGAIVIVMALWSFIIPTKGQNKTFTS